MSKGTRIFIGVITALLVLVCIYCLSFTFKVNSIEKNVIAMAEKAIPMQDPTKLYPNSKINQFLYEDSIRQERIGYKNRYLDSIQNEKVFLGSTYKSAKSQQLNLGLDLQGGMSVVLQVSLKELLVSMSDDNPNPAFLKSLDDAEKNMSSSQDDYISLFYEAFKKNSPNGKLAPIFATRQYADRINFNTSDNDVLDIIREEASSAINRTYSIITSRIDQFGTKQPTITLDPKKARINVEIAGVDNPARVRKLLQATANLEFWETYKASQIGQSINSANDALKTYLANNSDETTTTDDSPLVNDDILSGNTTTDSTKNTGNDLLSGNKETNASSDTSQEAKFEEFKNENPLFAVLQPAVDNNNRYMESPVIGYVRALDTAQLNSYLNNPDVRAAFPKDIAFMYGAKAIGGDSKENKVKFYAIYAIKVPSNSDEPPLDGSAISEARADIDQYGQTIVSMQMNTEGARTWSDLTGKNVGNNIAIVLDNQVYSAPTVNGQIDGGSSQISGGFTTEEATDLANVLKTGKLPASARIIEEELVGPSLGEQSIRAGLISLAVSIFLIFVFMVAFYSSGGFIAILMMLLNMLLIVGLLAGFGATLTLPGIAGIVLTLGMAVDANVIIYERIKEELRHGKTVKTAIEEGYKHSYSAIIDGNVTTFITGLILLGFGMGPIRGFAVTLCIGIFTTLFTAVLLSKVILDARMEKGKYYNYVTNFTKNFLQGKNFDFIGKRKISYTISAIILTAGFVSIFTRGFDLGVDFTGGREYKVRFEKGVETNQIKDALTKTVGDGSIVKQFGASNQVKITTHYLIKENTKEADAKVERAVYEGLKPYLNNESFETFKQANLLSSTKIDPTISLDFRKSSFKVTILALLAIFLYILLRFRKYGYSVGAVVATLHDALIVVGLFSLLNGIMWFPLEVDQHFIAAILTIIGYSINDTVIIFDRLREYIGERPNSDLKSTMNDAINSTLSRTFNTAFTVFIVVFILFLFGGSVLKSFSFAMLLGVVIGVYSSVFIASPIMYDVDNFVNRNIKNKDKAASVK
ncbi:MAG: protein translocase subunit SecDF [Chitinophagales bacterium]|nr:protein translocase subunit SecDF [Chitinophagales bacterium]